jgi:protocatechuate 3,4-dioxygenase beta subunit
LLPLLSRINSPRSLHRFLIAALLLLPAGSAQASWKITLDGGDITGPSAPIDGGAVPLINILSVAPALGLQARVTLNGFTVVDARGIEWLGRGGGPTLEALGRSLSLTVNARIFAGAVYLPVDAAAELAGLQVRVDAAKTVASLARTADTPRPAPDSPGGWEGIIVEKSALEKALYEEPSPIGFIPQKRLTANLPPGRGRIDYGIGFGHVQGGDWGAELTAAGNLYGVEANFGTFLTFGPLGFRPRSGRLTLVDEEFGRAGEIGEMFSDLWGMARGIRYSWRVSEDRWPSISLYQRNSNTGPSRLAAAVRDEVKVSRSAWLGAEAGSDGSAFLKGRLQYGRLNLHAYRRLMSDSTGQSAGAFVNYDVSTRMSIYGSLTNTQDEVDRTGFQNLGVRLPLRAGMDLALETSRTSNEFGSRLTQAAMLTMPVGPLRVLTRYNHTSGVITPRDAQLDPFLVRGHLVTFAAGYTGNSRFSLDYQANMNWNQGASLNRWEQVTSTFRLTKNTQIQTVTAFPDMLSADRMQMRLLHGLSRNLTLSVDYGPLSNFQPDPNRPLDRGVLVMLRTRLGGSAPKRGGEIRGTVVDQNGKSIQGAAVRVGEYRAITDKDGRYQMRHIPPGSYEVSLDNASLPADSRARQSGRIVAFTSRSLEIIDFKVIPLNAISGRVWEDANGNGEMDSGEGVPNIVIHLAGRVTATDAEGGFAFYNVEPGTYTARMDTARLPLGMLPVTVTEIPLTLKTDGSGPKLIFQLYKKEKTLLLETIP